MQQRGPLASGQRLDRQQRGAEPGSPLDLVRASGILPVVVQLGVVSVAGAELVEGDVARDPAKPGAQFADLRPGAQRLKRPHERLLHSVLGPVVPEHATAVPKQVRAVAEHDRREGGLVALAHEGGQVSVRFPQEQRRGEETR
jgi:hypothetical protein